MSNVRSTSHEKCDPSFINSHSNKGLGSSKSNYEKMTISYMKKRNGKCVSTLSNFSKEELEKLVEKYS